MMSGDEFYDDETTSGLTPEQERDLDRYLDVARKYDRDGDFPMGEDSEFDRHPRTAPE
jgi:hypothetical protein